MCLGEMVACALPRSRSQPQEGLKCASTRFCDLAVILLRLISSSRIQKIDVVCQAKPLLQVLAFGSDISR